MMTTATSDHAVRHFREVLFWPVQLMPLANAQPHWELLAQGGAGNPWRRLKDRFQAGELDFEERHYKEFVAFLPYIQRFIYGESHSRVSHDAADPAGGSAIKIFRRRGVDALRLVLREGDAPITLAVEHIELWFFDDINVAFLKVELSASDLLFADVCNLLYRFGRAYPTGWDEHGHGKHNAHCAEWLSADGVVLAASDTDNREKFLSYTREHRSPGIAAHWDFLLRPLVLDPSEETGILRYRQIEYHRMPLMAFLAVDDPRSISREDWLRLGLVATLHPDEALPTHDPDVAEFESRYCYDRFWTDTEAGPNTRFLCTGRAFIAAGDARADYFHDRTCGILAQFRHQYVLLFMIAHFHRASLLVFSDRMVDAVHDLDIRVAQSISRFRRRVYAGFEAFLRFTHRYWFHELSERSHVQALYRLCSEHLGNDGLYQEVKEELRDMSQYLDSNAQRQQSTTIVRLTVVTVFSMVGAVVTGFFGMNLLAYADQPLDSRVEFFFIVTLITTVLMLFTLLYSKQLSDVMDVLSDDQKSLRTRLSMLGKAWQRTPPKT
ncbi:MAG: CorA family divalent cation transporter [Gallionellaceae bacterium]